MAEWRFSGPFPLDLLAVGASASAALDHAELLVAEDRRDALCPVTGAPMRPGLYLLWRMDDVLAVAGFWLVFGPSYLTNGPPGPPDREPPFARDLLTAATESVWWQQLSVWPREGDRWRPIIVLEWPPELATRAANPPPGVRVVAPVRAREETGEAGWLDEPTPQLVVEVEATADDDAPYADLPAARSLLTVVRAQLSQRRGRHAGEFQVQDRFPAGTAPLDLDAWIGGAGESETAPPLLLPGGRVGFPLMGWLTRTLTLWPLHPQDLRPGTLQERDIGRRWRRQVGRVISSTVGVLAAVLYLAWLVNLAAAPQIKTSPSAPKAEPQPAMSVCSADHEHFVEELRCQLASMAAGDDLAGPVCGDHGAPEDHSATRADLQATWCGLRDRDLDGWKAPRGAAFADLAASKACFNVLGHPYSYALAGRPEERWTVDPERFLRDRDLALVGLVGLVGELDASCDVERGRLQSQIEGAILATLVGAPQAKTGQGASEASTLRGALVEQAIGGRARDESLCYAAGTQVGIGAPRVYGELCAGEEQAPLPGPAGRGWVALAGEDQEDSSVIARYTDTRFGSAERRHSSSTAPWQCHLDLYGARRRDVGAVQTRWDLTAPLPARYEVRQGLVRSQLVLDAALRAIADGVDAGPCWQVVARDLAPYTPVHPLLGPETAAKWPSPEQQLCGQVCAARYRVRHAARADQWLTPGADLSMCVSDSAPSDQPDFGGGHLDRLSLPWNRTERGAWVAPNTDEICAFNLVSQGYFPSEDGGVLVGGLAPPLWAGATATGSALAGGPGGAAVDAAKSLGSYGRSRSEASCGYVATQCFVAGGLRVLADTRAAPYQWVGLWRQWLGGITPGDQSLSPWCGLVAPYLHADGALPEGQMDYPCANGVDQTRRGVDLAFQQLAAGDFASVQR